eukprot:scpid91392/ scgid28503/ 
MNSSSPAALTKELFNINCLKDHTVAHHEWFTWTSEKGKHLLAIITEEFNALLQISPRRLRTMNTEDFVKKLILNVLHDADLDWHVTAPSAGGKTATLPGNLHRGVEELILEALPDPNSGDVTLHEERHQKVRKATTRWLKEVLSWFLIAYAIEVVKWVTKVVNEIPPRAQRS